MNTYGKLYLVATPIGNLEDITFRAIRILKEVDLVAAEDTRRTGILFAHYGISTKITSFFKGNENNKSHTLIQKILEGKSIALVSDAGTPGISDPAYALVDKALEHNINVVAIPGASAVITALSVSGLKTESFIFEGFLPRKKGKLEKKIQSFLELPQTIVFYESPNRIEATLEELQRILGNRNAVIARELTKKFEEYLRGTLGDLLLHCQNNPLKGELTVLVEGAEVVKEKKRKDPSYYK